MSETMYERALRVMRAIDPSQRLEKDTDVFGEHKEYFEPGRKFLIKSWGGIQQAQMQLIKMRCHRAWRALDGDIYIVHPDCVRCQLPYNDHLTPGGRCLFSPTEYADE